MVSREKKLRLRRIVRRQKKQVGDIGYATEEHFDRHVFKRLMRLPKIQRFLAGWLGLFLLLNVALILQSRALSNHYQVLRPQAGGVFTEGIIGSFTNANPIYAANSVDASVSKLLFSSLLKYDQKTKLTGDLAESWKLDANETAYTVRLKENIYWHDGKKLDAKDVVFTYQLIQNPEVKSFLLPSWRGVKVSAVDDRTVQFKLPNKLSSFPHSLTNGILPEHLLKDIPPGQLRSHSFNNSDPVGSGPFSFEAIEVTGQTPNERQERIGMKAFDKYHFGRPKLDRFNFRTFGSEDSLVIAYENKQVNAMNGLSSTPDQFKTDKFSREFGLPLYGEVLVFFKTNHEALKDPAVRKALVLSVDKKKLLNDISYPLMVADQPLLRSHIGYSKKFAQATNKPSEAEKLLDAAGWKKDPKTKIRSKNGEKLSFRLLSQTNSEYSSVTSSLQKDWHKLGVEVQVELQPDEELQTNVALHNYDALLYGISLGPDPDVFAYWHSSQADPRSPTKLNFSEYKSPVVDRALEAGRTRSDSSIRAVKYRPFLEAWNKDAPALALYQPRFLYLVRTPFDGFESISLNSSQDRFNDIQNWTVREARSNTKDKAN